jgi:hypothetical protein
MMNVTALHHKSALAAEFRLGLNLDCTVGA